MILEALKNTFSASIENPNVPLGWEAIQHAIDFRGGGPTDTGITVSPEVAMRFGAVFACVRVIAGTIGSLPLKIYKNRKGGGRDEATDHKLYPILHDRPNAQMSSMVFREAVETNTLLWGKSFAELQYDGAGRVVGLWPIRASLTDPVRDKNGFRFVTTDTQDSQPRTINPEDMLYIPGLSFDGVTALSVVGYARQAIALGLAAEKFGAKLFSNGARASGILSYPGKLGEKGRSNLVQSFDEKHQGADNAHKTILLEEGTKYQQTSIPPDDAQFLETRKYQRSEICGWFGMQPHMIGDLEHATFSNIEQQDLEFGKHCIRPRLVRWEQELNWKLFKGTDFVVEFNLDALLRGDFKSRQEGFQIQRQNGIINRDDWANKENMNPIGGEAGTIYIVPSNFTTPEKLAVMPAPGTAPNPANPKPADTKQPDTTKAFRPVMRDAIGRVVDREPNKRNESAVSRMMLPALLSIWAACEYVMRPREIDEYVAGLTRRAQVWAVERVEEITEYEMSLATDVLEVV